MKPSILITGHRGLVGTALTLCLSDRGYLVRGLDLRAQLRDGHGDVRDADAVQRAMHGTTGVVHLAAVSRVVWGEREATPGPSRWRDTESYRLTYDTSHLPKCFRDILYDEMKPLDANTVLGLGGVNREVGQGDHFFFLLTRRS